MTAATNSSARVLKPDQAAAARTLDCHVSVTAGPGAGKTTVLVERYLEILRTQKVSVDNIVAITFTNRAANEMRERVRKEIDELLRSIAGEERQRWLRQKRSLEAAVITTIHGFCSRLLHEFPVEANVDPQFVLLDEHQAMMLLDAVVEEALTESIQHGNEKIVQMAQGLGGRSTLAAALAELYRKYRGEGLSIDEIEKRTAANHARRDEYVAALRELDAQMSVLISARGLSRDAEEKRRNAAQEWPSFRAILAQPPAEQTIARYCQAIEDFREMRPRKGSAPGVVELDELLWGNESNDRLGGKVPALGFDLLAKDYALATLKLLREIERRLEDEKQRLAVLDFDDLQLRALKLLTERPEAKARITDRYRFFLVDEFQDTNALQRDLMKRLALGRGINLFIVGDRKQSIYGFRGADVDVFREMTEAIETAGGKQQPLQRNFRSQQPLIACFNFLFARIFAPRSEIATGDLSELGYVSHEPSEAERGADQDLPSVELLVSVLGDHRKSAADPEDEEKSDQPGVRERDAAQIVERINSLNSTEGFKYGEIAILFRALTGVWIYESALRRAGIPYLTVQGKGFYQREEITDLIQLLRFLDNTTDELALAAILRSPLCGISDNALFALRCAPHIGEKLEAGRLRRRKLLPALHDHQAIDFIADEEHAELDRAAAFLDSLIGRRNRYSISELLRQAVSESDFKTVVAANFDGAQRIANVEKLFRLAEQFEKSGYLIRDFVNYVEEFEFIGGRESEGQMDESANVVRLMTVHQAKGLEYPVVIIPDLHREPSRRDPQFVLDRGKGLSLRVPDGRGRMVRGAFLDKLEERAGWREEFESMRLLYVAATRAKDRLIFSGAIARKSLKNLGETKREHWLAWLWQALELDEHSQSEVRQFDDEVRFDVRIDRDRQTKPEAFTHADVADSTARAIDVSSPLIKQFPLLQAIASERGQTLRRFSVTQLINFQRCPRQYYFDRLLRAPGAEERAVWNDADAPEPPANLTATLKGAVIHRFCETFAVGEDPETRLRSSFEDVIQQRQAELAGRVFEINEKEAVQDLMPLAQNYLDSDVFQRVCAAQRVSADANPNSELRAPHSSGLWSELRFRLRRPLGILTGTIDKLLIRPAANGDGFDVEIIDFKTNRFRSPANRGKTKSTRVSAAGVSSSIRQQTQQKGALSIQPAQGLFDFESPADVSPENEPVGQEFIDYDEDSLRQQIELAAHDYQLQMQAYALALRELMPANARIGSLRATLHFIDPNVEIHLPPRLLEPGICAQAIDAAMTEMASLDGTLASDSFPPLPAPHCRMCKFLDLCPAGSEWLRAQ
jgi:ATP-dependent helicase/nuclease subunit A